MNKRRIITMYGCQWNDKDGVNWRMRKRLDSQLRDKEMVKEFQNKISEYRMVG